MRRLAYLLGLIMGVASGPGIAHSPPSVVQPAQDAQPVSAATASSLARVVAPMDVMVPIEIEQAHKAILALPTVDEDAKQLEADYPGLYAALWVAIEPEIRRQVEADYPGYWAALEQLYAKRLTENEAQAVMRFFKSSTGQKLIRSMYGSVDAMPIFTEMAKTDSYTIDEKQMKSMADAARAKAVKQIGPEDDADLWILMASIKLDRFQALGAETQKLTLEWVNKEDAESDARLAQMMEQAMQRFMAAHPSEK